MRSVVLETSPTARTYSAYFYSAIDPGIERVLIIGLSKMLRYAEIVMFFSNMAFMLGLILIEP